MSSASAASASSIRVAAFISANSLRSKNISQAQSANATPKSTVVPIGSDVEEVHALGLKKFVEEAKLLWNLSTPTRHPNIVSVRSLFEIHGTAYMVMDFEDGVSLSKLLKEGRRFNERSLWNIIKPIAEGLDRAHRVGVLHRDIKPPNILITDDNRPVLIDFGSARFEAAEATSTSVTFHTPPYAALEQYVKTYPQGPWTDIYALAVVLYECVTGEKPPEVLERLHGGLGTPLAEGHWPGFSKRFLQAIDAGMTIQPSERPQSIREWLALFGKKDDDDAVGADDEPTRFFAHEMAADEIAPVAPPAPGIDQKELSRRRSRTIPPKCSSSGPARKPAPPRRTRRRSPTKIEEAAEAAAPVRALIAVEAGAAAEEARTDRRSKGSRPHRSAQGKGASRTLVQGSKRRRCSPAAAPSRCWRPVAGGILHARWAVRASGEPLEIPDLNGSESQSRSKASGSWLQPNARWRKTRVRRERQQLRSTTWSRPANSSISNWRACRRSRTIRPRRRQRPPGSSR